MLIRYQEQDAIVKHDSTIILLLNLTKQVFLTSYGYLDNVFFSFLHNKIYWSK